MVTDDATDGRPWPIDPSSTLSSAQGPVPVPDLAVSDDDRTRYGLLLDHAAERGLVSPLEYEVRLGELAAATSIDQMKQIVTELPAFTAPAAVTTPNRSRRSSSAVAPGSALAAVGGRRRPGPWVLLGMIVLVIAAALVFFSIYAEHLTRNHNVGIPALSAAIRLFSALRL
jgi:hypothetical protein